VTPIISDASALREHEYLNSLRWPVSKDEAHVSLAVAPRRISSFAPIGKIAVELGTV
jgi:hypothetical protein